MRTEEYTPNYLELGFNENNIDDLRFSASDDEKEMYYPCHAIQILGALGTLKPFDALLNRLDDFVEYDYYQGAVAYYLRKVGKDKQKELLDYFLNAHNELQEKKSKKGEVSIDNIKIDKLTKASISGG